MWVEDANADIDGGLAHAPFGAEYCAMYPIGLFTYDRGRTGAMTLLPGHARFDDASTLRICATTAVANDRNRRPHPYRHRRSPMVADYPDSTRREDWPEKRAPRWSARSDAGRVNAEGAFLRRMRRPRV